MNQQPQTCGLAIWSLVLGILGLMCFSFFSAIPGVICGHKALRRIRESGGLLGGKGLAVSGLITGYLAIALAIILIPILMAMGFFVSKRAAVRTQMGAPQMSAPQRAIPRSAMDANVCINNLRIIEGAKAQWALEKNKGTNDIPASADLDVYIGNGGVGSLKCPAGGTYTINAGDTEPTCSVSGHALTN